MTQEPGIFVPAEEESPLTRFTCKVFLVLLGLHTLLTLYAVYHQPLWSPKDELAHYDYIDKLSNFRIPRMGERISDYSLRLTLDYSTWKNPKGFNGTAKKMGVNGLSYEAQQPALYYLLLAGPNRILKSAGLNPLMQIFTLRCYQWIFILLGLLLAIPIFKELSLLFGTDPLWGYVWAFYLSLSITWTGVQLTNDNLSLLAGNAVLYATLRFMRDRTIFWNISSAFLTTMALWVKATNGLFLLLHLIVRARAVMQKNAGRRWRMVAFALPFLFILLQTAFNIAYHKDLFKISMVRDHFSSWVLPIHNPLKFIVALFQDSVDLKHLGLHPTIWVGFVLLLVVGAKVPFYCIRWFRTRALQFVPAISALAISLGVIGSALTMNYLCPGVRWASFRHDQGYALFWGVSLWQVPFGSKTFHRKYSIPALAVLGLAAEIYYAYRIALVYPL